MQKTLDIRVYSAEGRRRRFPSSCVESVKWELSDRGYFGNFTVELKEDFDSALSIIGGDRLEVWLDGARRYRGYVAVPEQQLEVLEKRIITGHGLAERLNSICIDKMYMYQAKQDASLIFRDIVEDYILPRIPNIEIDAQVVDFATDEFSAKDTNARSALDQLVEISGKQAVWGVDVDPETGSDRIFLHPRSTEEKYKFQVGGKVKSYSYPPDYSKIVNSVHLKGGKSAYPNKVENPSFENPIRSSATFNNLMINGGFEDGTNNWKVIGSASLKNGGDGPPARTGGACLEMDNYTNGYIEGVKQFGIPVDAGEEHNLEIWYIVGENSTPKWHAEVQPTGYDYLRCAYYESNGKDLGWAWLDGASMQYETIDSDGDVGSYIGFALDDDLAPHVLYYDATNHRLKYATKKSGSWAISAVDDSGDVGKQVDLKRGTDGSLHAAYYDATNKALKYAIKAPGGSWIISTVDATNDSGSYLSLALSTEGYPRIAYYHAPNGGANGSLKFASYDESGWQMETVEASARNGYYSGRYCSLAIGMDNIPRICYISTNITSSLAGARYAYKSGEVWTKATVDTTGIAAPTDIAVGRDNLGVVAYSSDRYSICKRELTATPGKFSGNLIGTYMQQLSYIAGAKPMVMVDSQNKIHMLYNNNWYWQTKTGSSLSASDPLGYYQSYNMFNAIGNRPIVPGGGSSYGQVCAGALDHTKPVIRFPSTGYWEENDGVVNYRMKEGLDKEPLKFMPPAACSSVDLIIVTEPGGPYDNFGIDDVAIYTPTQIVQKDWISAVYDENNNVVTNPASVRNNINWVWDKDKYHAAYAVRWEIGGLGSKVARVLQNSDKSIDIKPNLQHTLSVKAKKLFGEPILKLALEVTNQNDEKRWVEGDVLNLTEDWVNYSFPFISGGTDKSVRIGCTQATAGAVLLDAIMFTEANPDDITGAYFISGEDYEWNFAVGDSFMQSDSTVPSAVKQSTDTYGLREAKESVDSITKTSQAKSWAKGYFGVNAQPVASHKLTVVDPEVEIKPDGHVKLLGVSTPSAFPVKVSYSLGGDNVLNASVELSTERPSFELLLAKMARK